MCTRRMLLASAAAPLLRGAGGRLRIGVTDWNLRLAGKPEAVELAARLGFEGVEVSLGRNAAGGRLPLDDAALQDRYLELTRRHGIAVAGVCLDILHVNYLKNDRLALKWISDGVPIARKLNARVMLLPFFGKGALGSAAELDYVGDALREVAPQAERAGVLLGLEDTIPARDNVRIMDRSRSSAVKVYYDVGNATNAGFDPLAEIPWLGAARICQFHLKDKGYLGEGAIDFPAILKTILALDYDGFANLETSSPSQSVERDMELNLKFVRRLLA